MGLKNHISNWTQLNQKIMVCKMNLFDILFYFFFHLFITTCPSFSTDCGILNKDARAVTNWCIHNLTQTLG